MEQFQSPEHILYRRLSLGVPPACAVNLETFLDEFFYSASAFAQLSPNNNYLRCRKTLKKLRGVVPG